MGSYFSPRLHGAGTKSYWHLGWPLSDIISVVTMSVMTASNNPISRGLTVTQPTAGCRHLTQTCTFLCQLPCTPQRQTQNYRLTKATSTPILIRGEITRSVQPWTKGKTFPRWDQYTTLPVVYDTSLKTEKSPPALHSTLDNENSTRFKTFQFGSIAFCSVSHPNYNKNVHQSSSFPIR